LTGQINEHLYRTTDPRLSSLGGLAIGHDGNIWFSQTNPVQDGMNVYVRRVMRVDPSSVVFSGVGQSHDVSVTESYYHDAWTASTSDPGVATVMQGNPQSVFAIESTGPGSATITIADAKHNDFQVQVTVH